MDVTRASRAAHFGLKAHSGNDGRDVANDDRGRHPEFPGHVSAGRLYAGQQRRETTRVTSEKNTPLRFAANFRLFPERGFRRVSSGQRGPHAAMRPWVRSLPGTLSRGCMTKIQGTSISRTTFPHDRFVASGSAHSTSEEMRICFQIDTSSMSTYSLRRPHGPNSAWQAPMT